MACNSKAKLKPFYLLKILQEETDAEHGLTMPHLIERLSEYGISAERKSIYADIEVLRAFDIEVKTYQRKPVEYAIERREFTLGELMLMVDAIESCCAITKKQSDMLITNIKTLANNFEQAKLDRHIHVVGRIKAKTESVFEAINCIHEAIRLKKKVTFSYFRRKLNGECFVTHEGKPHEVTPLSITYAEGFYYLSAWDDGHKSIIEYRIDRMGSLELSQSPAAKDPAIDAYTYDTSDYVSFGRFRGNKMKVSLFVQEGKDEIVFDRFGEGIVFTKEVTGGMQVRVRVYVSEQFFGWIAGMGKTVQLVGSKSLVENYRDYLKQLLEDTTQG